MLNQRRLMILAIALEQHRTHREQIMDMKDLIQQMTNIESEEKSKKQINEGASMNISMNADDAAQVGQRLWL